MSSDRAQELKNEYFISLDTSLQGSIKKQVRSKDDIINLLNLKYPQKQFSTISINHQYQKCKKSHSVSPNFIACIQIWRNNRESENYQYSGIFEFISQDASMRIVWETVNMLDNGERIRDISFAPAYQHVYLALKDQIRKYAVIRRNQILENQTKFSSQYSLSQEVTEQIMVPNNLSISEIMFHPSGKYQIATAISQSNETHLIKVVSGQLAQILNTKDQNCIQTGFLNQQTLDFDHSSEHGFITGYQNSVCYWDGNKFSLLSNVTVPSSDLIYYGPKPFFQKPGTINIHNIRHISHPNSFVAFEKQNNRPHFFVWDKLKSQLSYQFSITLDGDYDNSPIRNQILPLQIPELSAILFYQKNYQIVQFIKVFVQERQKLSIKNKQINAKILQTFYDRENYRICFIVEKGLNYQEPISINCFDLLSSCDDDFLSLRGCIRKCQDKDQLWNATTWQCKDCPQDKNCACSEPYQSANVITGQCELDCYLVQSAYPSSQYMENGQNRCLCQSNYGWSSINKACLTACPGLKPQEKCECPLGYIKNQENTQCLIDCSQVKYSAIRVSQNEKPQQSILSQKCICLPGFQYTSSGIQDQIGKCEIKCEKDTKNLWKNGRPFCNCGDSEEWDSYALKCNILQQGLQGLVIALIVILTLAIVSIIAFIVYKKVRKSPMQIRRAYSGTQENFSDRNEIMGSEKNSDRNNDHLQAICKVCEETGVNCSGPCHHQYHFNCIKGKIDMGDLFCPLCKIPFKNGLADIRIQQKDDEIFTIEDD